MLVRYVIDLYFLIFNIHSLEPLVLLLDSLIKGHFVSLNSSTWRAELSLLRCLCIESTTCVPTYVLS